MLLAELKQRLDEHKKEGLFRERNIVNHQKQINFGSNDYLGISQHPAVIAAFSEGAQKYGLGSGSSALIAGYCQAHSELEEQAADFFGRDRAMLFNSGYHANLGIITAFANRQSRIFYDRYCHASIIDAVILSRAQYRRYQHNDVNDLEQHLMQGEYPKSMIISESVFSMEGDIAPVTELVTLAKKYNSLLMIDDAHGAGVLGKTGRGICEFYQLTQDQVPVLSVPLGKAFGAMGAIVCGSHEIIENLIQFARSYRYSTLLPPAIAHTLSIVLQVIEREVWRRDRLHELIGFFIRQAQLRNLPLISHSYTPIQIILIGDNERVMQMQKELQNYQIGVAAIRPPTVPVGTARLRISLTCEHSEDQIIQLLDILAEQIRGHS